MTLSIYSGSQRLCINFYYLDGFISNVICYALKTWTVEVSDLGKLITFETDATGDY